jgi:putative transposase
MQYLKMDSSKWINESRLTMGRFEWQTGYGAFSYGHSQIDDVVKYIQNQEEHHRKRTFLEEYTAFLNKFDVPYDERYVFKPVEE